MKQDLTPEALHYVLHHLRAKDLAEIRATIARDDLEEACERLWFIPGPKWQICTGDGTPAVVGGLAAIWPGLVTAWMFGTDDWSDVALEVTRFVKRTILPELELTHGVHRIECRPMVGNSDVRRWLEFIGFRCEAVTAQFGQGREDFCLYARVAPHGLPGRLN